MRYQRLFQPISIGKLELNNRIAMPPITTNYARNGFVTDRMVDFYAERAQGGVALIIVEDCIIDAPRGRHTSNDTFICDDDYIPGLRRLAQAIKENGAKVAVQLSHAGRSASRLLNRESITDNKSDSSVTSKYCFRVTGFVEPNELTIEEIKEIEDKFAESARRAVEAGFDLISVHCTHGYLIEQFLSPLSNKRQDAYGGDAVRRFRFLSEVVQKIKQRVGDDFPLMCRISCQELIEGGLTLEDARQNAQRLEACGVNCISISISGRRFGESPDFGVLASSATMRSRRGTLVDLAAEVKEVISIPVMVANRIITPELAEQVLEQAKADLIGIGRGLVADAEWPRKALEGRGKEIRYCISCESCLPMDAKKDLPLACAVNPAVGHERESKIITAGRIKTVFIAGGGPAGMEAARVAALRGHKVRLYEKEMLGGQLNIACVPPGKDEFKMFIDFEREQLYRLGVRIEYRELTPEIVLQEKPDAVIIATGSCPVKPEFPGSHNKNVVYAPDVLRGLMPTGRVVVIGGRQVGAETAEFLASKGYEITVVEESDKIARDIAHFPLTYGALLYNLKRLQVNLLTGTTVEEIKEKEIVLKQKDKRFTIPADTVVIALGAKSNRTLADKLEKLNIELYLAGDCTGTGRLAKAVKEGFRAALAI